MQPNPGTPVTPHAMPAPHPDELSAAAVALQGSAVDRLRVAGKALLHLMKQPEDTEQVFVLGIALNAPRFPEVMARFVAEESGAQLLRDQPSIDSQHVDFARLRTLPETTLGGAFARHMDRLHLDPDLFQAPPGLPSTVAYIAKRIRQTHDVWHVLTGYATDVPGEIALQGFYYGHLHMPSAGAIALLGTLRYVGKFRDADLIAMVRDGYRRGKAARYLPAVQWEALWEVELDEVRRRFNILPPALPGGGLRA